MASSQQHRFGAIAIVSLLYGLIVLGGCQSASNGDSAEPDDSNDRTVVASMGEWYVKPDATEMSEGTVTFRVTNAGSIRHEFVVVRTSLAPGLIPVEGDARFNEKRGDITIVDEIPEYGNGMTKTLTVDLDAGSYQLVCNLPGHYRLGMWSPFTVG